MEAWCTRDSDIESPHTLEGLPDIVHCTIAGCLAACDILRVMAASCALHGAFRPHVQRLTVKHVRLQPGLEGSDEWRRSRDALARLLSGAKALVVRDVRSLGTITPLLEAGNGRDIEALEVGPTTRSARHGVLGWGVHDGVAIPAEHRTGVVAQWICGGHLPYLCSLRVTVDAAASVYALLDALAAGAAPLLHTLELNSQNVFVSRLDAVAGMLESRDRCGCAKLTRLALDGKYGTPWGEAQLRLCTVLTTQACAELESLRLSFWISVFMEREEPRALGAYLHTTGARHLRSLSIHVGSNDVIESIACALSCGAAKGLRYLQLKMRDTLTVRPLASAVHAGALALLEELDLSHASQSVTDAGALVSALARTQGGSRIRVLRLVACDETVAAVAGAMATCGFSSLHALELRSITDAQMVTLSKGLMARAHVGGRSLLRALEFSQSPLGYEGVMALASVVACGALRGVQKIDLSRTRVGEEGVVQLTRAIREAPARDMRILNLRYLKLSRPARLTLAVLQWTGECRGLSVLLD